MKNIANKKYTLLAVGILLVTIASGMFVAREWLNTTFYRNKVERTVNSELEPLKNSLEKLGFTDLSNLETNCGYHRYAPTEGELNIVSDRAHVTQSTSFDCSSGLNRFVRLPTDDTGKAAYIENVKELNKALESNGWKARADYPTVPWFEKLSQGVDYQPDQLNLKAIGDVSCAVDFFTSFSQPDSPAVTLTVSCAKQHAGS